MLDKVKLALRITTTAFDSELNALIQSAKLDLGIAGVTLPIVSDSALDAIIQTAVITYCKIHFGEGNKVEMLDRLIASYNEQKAQLSMATGYTTW